MSSKEDTPVNPEETLTKRLGKGFLNLFIKVEEEEDQPAGEKQTPDKTAKDSTIKVAGTVAANAEQVNKLVDSCLEHGQAEFEKLMQYVEMFKSTIPDETARYRSALQVVSQQGVTPERLVDAMNKQIAHLNTEETEFKEMIQQMQKDLGLQKTQLESIDRQTADLHKQLDTLQQQRAKINNEIGSQEVKINSATASFAKALEAAKQQLEARKTRTLALLGISDPKKKK
jgi:chromosome segregation ATPase